VATAKYRRMVGEISKLIDWAQQASSPGSASGRTPASASLARRVSAGAQLTPLGNAGNIQEVLAAAAQAATPGGKPAGSPSKLMGSPAKRRSPVKVAVRQCELPSPGGSIVLSPTRVR
jgi:hypothetical protein